MRRSHLRAACANGPDRLPFTPRIEVIRSRITAFSAAGTITHQTGLRTAPLLPLPFSLFISISLSDFWSSPGSGFLPIARAGSHFFFSLLTLPNPGGQLRAYTPRFFQKVIHRRLARVFSGIAVALSPDNVFWKVGQFLSEPVAYAGRNEEKIKFLRRFGARRRPPPARAG
jgi:hypothetical protein